MVERRVEVAISDRSEAIRPVQRIPPISPDEVSCLDHLALPERQSRLVKSFKQSSLAYIAEPVILIELSP